MNHNQVYLQRNNYQSYRVIAMNAKVSDDAYHMMNTARDILHKIGRVAHNYQHGIIYNIISKV